MTQLMADYTWQITFDRLEEQGPQRIITLFKWGLKEMPRLEKMFLSSTPDDHCKAREEIIALFHRIDLEMRKAMQNSPLSPEEFIKEVKKESHFSREELSQLSRVPELIGHHHNELFAKRAFDTPKKRSPFFKV